MAAGLATLEVYKEQQMFEQAAAMSTYWENAVHSLRDIPIIKDIRNIGLMAAFDLEVIPGRPTKRAFDVFDRAFEKGVFLRPTGNTIAMSPHLNVTTAQIDQIVETFRAACMDSIAHLK